MKKQIEVGDWVFARCKVPEDSDYGRVIKIFDDGTCQVSWYASLTRTNIELAQLTFAKSQFDAQQGAFN